MKKKHKTLICPHGGKFAKDWFQKLQCEKRCKLSIECEEVWEDKYFKVNEDDEDDENDRLKRHSDDDEDEKPQSKKHKKSKQDNRGLYIPRPALNKLLNVTYHTCVRHYLFYMKEAIRQKTNRPWCNSPFTAKGLNCSESTVEKAKDALVEAGFIKKVRAECKDGRYSKTYIELQYLPTKFKIEKAEYNRRIDKLRKERDEMVEEGAYWINCYTSEMMKLEVMRVKYRKLRRENCKLKKKRKNK